MKLRNLQEGSSMDGNEVRVTQSWSHWGDSGLHLPLTQLCTDPPVPFKQINLMRKIASLKHNNLPSVHVHWSQQQVAQRSVNKTSSASGGEKTHWTVSRSLLTPRMQEVVHLPAGGPNIKKSQYLACNWHNISQCHSMDMLHYFSLATPTVHHLGQTVEPK